MTKSVILLLQKSEIFRSLSTLLWSACKNQNKHIGICFVCSYFCLLLKHEILFPEFLNGAIGAKQNISYSSNMSRPNTFGTYKEVHLHINLTDRFPEPPPLTYIWFIDGTQLESENRPDLNRNFTKAGKHSVTGIAVVNDPLFQDCASNFYSQALNGSFSIDLELKGKTIDY